MCVVYHFFIEVIETFPKHPGTITLRTRGAQEIFKVRCHSWQQNAKGGATSIQNRTPNLVANNSFIWRGAQ
eukprot:3484269-Ditylum_brightwellii.AAC.1